MKANELQVGRPKGCNRATSAGENAPTNATGGATQELKVLENKILERNRECNQNTTNTENGCNFQAEKHPQKLQKSCIRNVSDLNSGAREELNRYFSQLILQN